MKRSDVISKAHEALNDVNLFKVKKLLDSVNLSILEKEIITKSELNKLRIYEIAEDINLSIDSVMRIKTKGMKKIAEFIEINDR